MSANYNIRNLTPAEVNLFDPTGNVRNTLRMIPSESYYSDLPPFIKDGDEFLEVIKRGLDKLPRKHQPYVLYSQEMFSKLGRQGGKFSYSDLINQVLDYYVPDFTGYIPQSLIRGRDFLIAMIKEQMQVNGSPQLVIPAHRPTFAAIPSGAHKSTWSAETLGINKVSIQRFFPTTPGQRRMRNKDRAIFMDATPNVRAQERYLTGARLWLRQYLPFFSAWKNPDLDQNIQLTKNIERRSWFVSWDYKSMDKNFRKRIALELILPIYETFFPDMALTIGSHIEQNFDQEIFLGDKIISGTHSLLSGANITNDFETLYTVILALGVCLEVMHYDELRALFALGDDMTLATRNETKARLILERAIEVSGLVGMVIHPEKSSVTCGEVTFCRRTYYPSAPRSVEGIIRGAYPTVLCVNNIVQPENPAFSEPVAFVSDLQRLDGIVDSPDKHNVFQEYPRHVNYQFTTLLEEWRKLDGVALADWWDLLYGEAWSVSKSLAFRSLLPYLRISHETRNQIQLDLNHDAK